MTIILSDHYGYIAMHTNMHGDSIYMTIILSDHYGYIAMHTNMHGDIVYDLSHIAMYIHIHGDITVSSNLSPCISLYTTILDTITGKSWG